jgi:O-antigen/teichoic acid export membrane protein
MLNSKYFSELSTTKQKVFTNLFWAVIGKVVNLLGSLFIGILVARYLGPEKYGLMNYVISYVSIFFIISSFGLDDIEIRELSKNPVKRESILGTAFRIRIIFAFITFVLILSTLFLFAVDRETFILVLIYSFAVFSSCFNVIRNYFTSVVENESVVKTEIFRTLFGALVKLVLLMVHAPLLLFMISIIFDTILIAGGYILSYQRKVGRIRSWKYDPTIVSFLLKQALPLVLSGAAVIIYQRIDQVMIGSMLDNISVGYFATAGKFLDIILFIPLVLTQTITPILVQKRERNLIEYEIAKQRFVSLIVWFSIGLSLIVSISAHWLVLYTFGSKYLASVDTLEIMSWKTVGMALSASSGQIIIMEGKQRWAVFRNLIGVLICVSLNFLFIPLYGIIGSAWVTIITVAFTGCFANFFIPPYHSILKIQLKAIFFGWREIANLKALN